MSSPRKRQPLSFAHEFVDEPKRQRPDGRGDRNLRRDAIERPFEKQSEREQRVYSEALEMQPTTSGRQDRVREEHRALHRQMVDEQSPVQILSARCIKNAKRKTWQPGTTIR